MKQDTSNSEIGIDYLIKRDFSIRRQPNLDSKTKNLLDRIYALMIELKVGVTDELLYDGLLIDTCYFFRGEIPHDRKIIITDGVILEILQGCIFDNKVDSHVNYQEDLQRLLDLKKEMKSNCVFLRLNNKSRKYYAGSQTKHSLRRNVDSELLLLALQVHNNGHQIKLATLDEGLKGRFNKRQDQNVEEKIIFNVSHPFPQTICAY